MAYIELTAKQRQGEKIQCKKLQRRTFPQQRTLLQRRKRLQWDDIYSVYLRQEGCDIDRAVEVLNRKFS